MAQVKGSQMIGVVKALRAIGPPARQGAAPHLHTYFSERLHAASWYSEKDYRDLTLLLGSLVRSSVDGNVWHAIGRMGAKRDFAGDYASMIRVGDPEQTLRRLPEGWRLYHDSGDLKLTKLSRAHACLELRAFPVMCPQIAEVIAGYFEGALKAVGVSSPLASVVESDAKTACWKLSWK